MAAVGARGGGRGRRGRPVLGALSGLFLGVFAAIDLLMLGVMPLHSPLVTALPVLGLVIGIGLGAWAPLRRTRSRAG